MSPSTTGILQGIIHMARERSLAFDVTYLQGGSKQFRLVYACDEHAAGLAILRSTWAPVVLLEVKPVVKKQREAPRDWKAVS